jgi:predicted small metal-binding protein
MSKYLRCDDIFAGCAGEVRAESEEDVLKQAAEHARRDHGVEEIDEATLAKVKAAVRDE